VTTILYQAGPQPPPPRGPPLQPHALGSSPSLSLSSPFTHPSTPWIHTCSLAVHTGVMTVELSCLYAGLAPLGSYFLVGSTYRRAPNDLLARSRVSSVFSNDLLIPTRVSRVSQIVRFGSASRPSIIPSHHFPPVMRCPTAHAAQHPTLPPACPLRPGSTTITSPHGWAAACCARPRPHARPPASARPLVPPSAISSCLQMVYSSPIEFPVILYFYTSLIQLKPN
jgi:hypothetical protein